MESISLITTQKLIHDLTRLGLRSGQTVLVHTSMKSLGGYIVGDAPAVVDALMTVLTPDGTLIMPTHSTNNTDPSTWRRPPFPERNWETFRKTMPPYRPEITPSNRMGVIMRAFGHIQAPCAVAIQLFHFPPRVGTLLLLWQTSL